MIASVIATVTGLFASLGALPILLGGLGIGGSLAAIVARFGLPKLLGQIELHRSWLLLLIVAIAAAGLYAWGAEADRERRGLKGWANTVCIGVGSELEPAGKPARVDCTKAVAALIRFRTDTAEASTRTLSDNLTETNRRTSADAASARHNADRAQRVAEELEKQNAKIGPDNRVGGDWLRAFNDAAGLRR